MKYELLKDEKLLKKEILTIAGSLGGEIRALSEEVFKFKEFLFFSATDNKIAHHYGIGGLIRHTHEVITLCLENARMNESFGNPKINLEIIFLAALYHDIGKIFDYRFDKDTREWLGTSHKRKIHHISRSGIVWSKTVEKTGLGKKIEDDVLHCILSHHGQRNYGSPITPLTREAWLLHLCDSISARMNDCDRLDMVKIDAEKGNK